MEYSSVSINKVNYIFEWLFRLVYINVLWILFTLAGGIIFGIFPATVAMFSVMRKWMNKEEEPHTFRMFLKYFKREFLKSNLLGMILITIGLFLYIDAKLIPAFEGILKYVLLGSYATVGIFYLLVLLYIFPFFVHYENSMFQYFKSILLIGVSYPFRTLLMGVSIISILFICFVFPAIAILFLGSGLCFIMMFFSNHLFAKMTKEQAVVN